MFMFLDINVRLNFSGVIAVQYFGYFGGHFSYIFIYNVFNSSTKYV